MTSITSNPRFVYKIVPSTSPVCYPIPEKLAVSELDEGSGFIHLSTAHQVGNTLKTFFADEPLVYVLRIEYPRVEEDIRWESPEGGMTDPRPEEELFPVSNKMRPIINNSLKPNVKHLYNGLQLGKEEVESVAIWQNDEGWDKALDGAKPWLVA